MSEEPTPILSLLAPLDAGARVLDGEWRVAFDNPEQRDDCAYASPELDDTRWEKVRLPRLYHSTAERDTLWYRLHFTGPVPARGEHTLLRLGGAFYETRVWLNGIALGTHEGYFQPFGVDLGEALQAGENVLAVRCRFPVEAGAFKRKTAVAGIFTDWDCKPYPSTYYPHLPAPHEWTVPIGLWQPVHLQTSGPILIESFNVFSEVVNPRWTEGADSANLRVVLQLRNLTPTPQNAHIRIDIAPHNFRGERTPRGEWDIAVEGASTRRVDLTLDLPAPRLWFPWTHGAPNLYRAELTLQVQDSEPRPLVQVFGVRALDVVIDAGRWEWRLNGRRIFPRGSNYISDFYLDRVSVEGLSRDLALARGANLDLLRVHAHIGPPDLYRLCDEQGVMVMCDLPLIWTYAYNLPPDQEAAFRASVLRQAQDMIDLLGSRPSIVLWSMHNEPPWTPDGSFLGADVHDAGTNRVIDQAAAEEVRRLDATRPTIAASGEYDQHLYHGWYTGSWQDNRALAPSFPTEFGVQALPSLDSPFWGTVNTNWPVEADDPTWAHAGYQSVFWVSPGVGGPSQYPSLAEYIRASQAYQAFYIRYTVDQWRRKKFTPTGGYIHFLFTDGWPAITWSVLDYSRELKAGYHALAEVSRPTHVCIDLEGFTIEGACDFVYAKGTRFKADLYLVNDDYRVGGRALLTWWLEPRPVGGIRTFLSHLRAPHVTVDLPGADQGAQLARTVELPLPRAGDYTFHTRLIQAGRVLDENHYGLRVGAPRVIRRAPRRVPRFLISRVYEFGSLRHTADGFTVRLRNPAMPVHVQRLTELRVDGQLLDPKQVDVLHGGQTHRAATITPEAPLQVSSGDHITVVVREYPLPPGIHELEAGVQLVGLGEIAARWKDRSV